MSNAKLDQAFLIAEELIGQPPDCIEALDPPVGGCESQSIQVWKGREKLYLKVNDRAGDPIGVHLKTVTKRPRFSPLIARVGRLIPFGLTDATIPSRLNGRAHVKSLCKG